MPGDRWASPDSTIVCAHDPPCLVRTRQAAEVGTRVPLKQSPATSAKSFTPPQYAARRGIGPDKVRGFIRAGELRAINMAADPNGRPQWLIPQEAIDEFGLTEETVALDPEFSGFIDYKEEEGRQEMIAFAESAGLFDVDEKIIDHGHKCPGAFVGQEKAQILFQWLEVQRLIGHEGVDAKAACVGAAQTPDDRDGLKELRVLKDEHHKLPALAHTRQARRLLAG